MGETRQHQPTPRPVIADLIRNPEGHGSVTLALWQYPQGGRVARMNKTTPTPARHCGLDRPFTGTRMMKNNVLLRCKRTRWHSVIRDSSIHRGGVCVGKQDNTTRPVTLALRQYPQGGVTQPLTLGIRE